MNPYIEKLNAFLEQQPAYKTADAASVLEVLQYYYTLEHPIDSTLIRCQFHEVDACLQRLTFEENNNLFRLICDLCCQHANDAFLRGLHTGLQLHTQLIQPAKNI